MTTPSHATSPLSEDSKPVWLTSWETSTEQKQSSIRKKRLKQSPSSKPHHSKLLVWLVTLKPQEDWEPSPPSGPTIWTKEPWEDSTRTGWTPRRRLSPAIKVKFPKSPRKLKSNSTESENIAQVSEPSFTPKWTCWPTWDKRKTTSSKSKSTEEKISAPKSTSSTDYSKRKSESIKFSDKIRSLMSSVSPRVKDLPVSWKDGVLDICKRNPTEVTEKSDVSELGIPLELPGLLLEPVRADISTELNLTRKSTESVKPPEVESRTTLPLKPISLKRTLPHLVVSPTMVLSMMTSLSWKDAVLDPERDSSYSENLC